jgi:signal transduction histidine kinase
MVTGTGVRITITDNGCGIPKKDMPFIFDTFYRGSNSRREEGRGFGLSIVKSVADSYGWPITVTSAEGKGSTFTITIPIA